VLIKFCCFRANADCYGIHACNANTVCLKKWYSQTLARIFFQISTDFQKRFAAEKRTKFSVKLFIISTTTLNSLLYYLVKRKQMQNRRVLRKKDAAKF